MALATGNEGGLSKSFMSTLLTDGFGIPFISVSGDQLSEFAGPFCLLT